MAPASDAPLKSILKNAAHGSSNGEAGEGLSRKEEAREIALHHARLIEQRKELEREILAATEELLEFPSSYEADPAQPDATEASQFKNYLKCFQPSDFDALVRERNINRQCGYALCPRPRPLQDRPGRLRIMGLRPGENFKVVPRETMDRWCSDECAKRGLYLRVQLDEEPAWVRAARPENALTLLEESDEMANKQLRVADIAKSMEAMGLDQGKMLKQHDLLEGSGSEALVKDFSKISIMEKDAAASIVSAPSESSDSSIEGYKPKRSSAWTSQTK